MTARTALATLLLVACGGAAEARTVHTRGDHPEDITCDVADTACDVADLGVSADCHDDANERCAVTDSFHGRLLCCSYADAGP